MTTSRIRGASARDVETARGITMGISLASTGGHKPINITELTDAIAAALSERERETVERTQAVVDAAIAYVKATRIINKLEEADDVTNHDWQLANNRHRITYKQLCQAVDVIRADAARRETP